MPISLPAFSRRKFLGSTVAVGLGAMLCRQALAAEVDPNRFFLFSDTHIPTDRALMNSGINMVDHLKQAVIEALAADARAASVLVNGDLAFKTGEVSDYGVFVDLIKPLREAGMPVHVGLGNHDDRARVWDAVKAEKDAGKGPGTLVEERYVTRIEAPHANWFILDSLDKTNSTPGVLGHKQVNWLDEQLDTYNDRPAIVMVHHHPVFKNPNAAKKAPEGGGEKKDNYESSKVSGIVDTEILWPVLKDQAHVKALFFGHTHNWSVTKKDEIHMINLPAVAYPFAKEKPTGWVDCKVGAKGMSLTLNCSDKKHANNGQKVDLVWR